MKEEYMDNKKYEKPVIKTQEKAIKTIEKPVEKKITKKTITKVNARIKPDGGMVRILKEGTTVTVTEVVNGWAHLDDGLYVMDKFLK